MTKTKKAGKALAGLVLLFTAVTGGASWYLGGQTRAVEKYCASLASGNLGDYQSVTEDTSFTDRDVFKTDMRQVLNKSGNFSDLEENDVIGSDTDVREHICITPEQWICTADIEYFCKDMSLTCTEKFTMVFRNGRWIITDTGLDDME